MRPGACIVFRTTRTLGRVAAVSVLAAAFALGARSGDGAAADPPARIAQWGPVVKGKASPQPQRTPGSNTSSDAQRRVGGPTFGTIRK